MNIARSLEWRLRRKRAVRARRAALALGIAKVAAVGFLACGIAATRARADEAEHGKDPFTEEDRAYWAFEPLARPMLPVTERERWVENPIDAFLLARIEGEGLEPSPPASPRELLRRAWIDALGLPPSPEDIKAFESDARPDRWERLVDRLLASPAFGERQGRFWLDVVRYAESDGFRADAYRPLAWKYRDWVVRSLNEDKPYDRFIAEQIAGDEAFPDSPEALIATGYLRHFPYEHNQRNLHLHRDEIINDITTVTAEAFLGLGLACARCHDHKFDPLLQTDYFRLRAFFEPVLPRDDLTLGNDEAKSRYASELARWEAETATIRAELEELARPIRATIQKTAYDLFHDKYQRLIDADPASLSPIEKQLRHLAMLQLRVPEGEIEKRLDAEAKKRWQALEEELARHPKPAPLPPVLAAVDVGPEAPPTLIPGKEELGPVAPGFPAILDDRSAEILPSARTGSTGRRTALAEWLNRDDNPLVPRVIVNRIWQVYFGRGIVSTTNDFGRLGEPPTHPELLDWLAVELIENGRSLKHIHRLILTSSAYRQSARVETDAQRQAIARDPANRLFARMPLRRLEAEAIRDAMLVASGEIDLSLGGPSEGHDSLRRSIYLEVRRNSPAPFHRVFDGPDGFNSCGARNITVTAPQSLFLLNNEWTIARARALADLVRREARDEAEAIELLYLRVLGRSPRPAEIRAATSFLASQRLRIEGGDVARTSAKTSAAPLSETSAMLANDDAREAWLDLAHVLLNTNELLYRD